MYNESSLVHFNGIEQKKKEMLWNCCAAVGFNAGFFKRIINSRFKEEIKTEKKLKDFIVALSKTSH